MTEKEIHTTCAEYNITNYTINDNLSIDVNGDVYLFDEYFIELPLYFNIITGDFALKFNNLFSLKGAPKYVGDEFYCYGNKIKTLYNIPEVKGKVTIIHNPISELWNLFRKKDYIEYFNDLDIIIDNGETVILDRLNYFLQDIGDQREIDKLENYKTI